MRHLSLSVLFFVFLGLLGCKDKTGLVEAPPCNMGAIRQCYNDQSRKEIEASRRSYSLAAGRGICNWGIQTCTGDDWTTCADQGEPQFEICDGLDNNCDGLTDNNFVDVDGKNIQGASCGNNKGQCRAGRWQCVFGTQVCIGQVGPQRYPNCMGDIDVCGLEICDGLDNDCDGLTDEDMPVKACYTGPPETVAYRDDAAGIIVTKGVCRPGLTWCTSEGQTECMLEILPDYTTSECTNEPKDFDCDGTIDFLDATPVDINICVDRSGSMNSIDRGISSATDSFVAKVKQFSNVWIGVCRLDSNSFGEHEIVHELAPAVELVDMATVLGPITGSGTETTLELIVGMYRPEAPFYPAWRPGERHVALVFTDEICSGRWCSPVVGCEVGHWCHQVTVEGNILQPEDVSGFAIGSDVEVIVFTTTGALKAYYEKAGVTVIIMPRDPQELAKQLETLLLKVTCEEQP